MADSITTSPVKGAALSSLSITHSLEAGTLVDGTERGDGSAAILKAHRFRWSRNLGQWFAPHSRDRIADRYRIDRAAEELRAAGFDVAVSIDNSANDPAEAHARQAERAERRAEGLTLKAERKGQEAQQAFEQFRRTLDVIPPGQPILVGHHSERGHRATLARADRAIARSAEADRERQGAEHGAAAALAGQRRKRSPTYIGNRIREAEAEIRDVARRLAGTSVASGFGRPAEGTYRDDLIARGEQAERDLAYWREQLEACAERIWTQADFSPGDRALIRGRWVTVRRANKTTLSVESGYSWANRYPYTEVRDRRAKDAA